MRKYLIAAAFLTFALPAAAQGPAPSGAEIEAIAPALDRATGAMLNIDVGPLLDALDPYGRHAGPRTLGDIARRDDPYFEQRLRGRIYGTTAAMARMADAFAAAEPALRRSLFEIEREIENAVEASRPPLPPGNADDDWDREYEDGPEDEPYED